ncbi:MAG TPA: hypothetical protein VE959_12770 [Bryobacteraceae bacterium]|nr:hypothetical protein [Bryobacteraceae bacterium]
MNHLSEEQLILHYYGEEADPFAAEQHLEGCADCRTLYGSLQRVLNVVDSLPVPERGPEYGAQLRERLQSRLAAAPASWPRSLWNWLTPRTPLRVAAATAAFSLLLAAAFVAGRFYPQAQKLKPAPMAAADPQVRERILLVAVGDYLDRSQMVLVELANARPDGPLDISAEQARAADLVSESRLYRQTAAHTGDAAVATVLEDLDRVLLEIAHGPSSLSPGELDKLRQRLEAEGILFKIRVLGSNVRNEEEPGPAGRQKL